MSPENRAVDEAWMRQALGLAEHGAGSGEVPVGALLVRHGAILGHGYNAPVQASDPSAHAEIVALRSAAQRAKNYRLPGTTLYVTLEPCVMCAGAIVQARVARVVFAAADPRAGAAGSVFNVFEEARLNHRPECSGGILADLAREQLRAFFQARRGKCRDKCRDK